MTTCSLFTLTALSLATASACAQTVYAPSLAEYERSTTVKQLGIEGVHGKGIIGQGVIVGVLDTGINMANPEFKDNKRILAGFNVTGKGDMSDTLGHGTHVAGIIAAGANGQGMYGVAPGVTLLPVKVFNGSSARGSDIDKGLIYANAQGAKVINLSLGAPGPTGTTALQRVAATNRSVIVVAAGNDGAADPIWPARYAKEPWAKGTMIAVGAVDARKTIASFSNKAGDTAQFYLVAPSMSIYSTIGTGYGNMTGTSMAAPAVSGAAALMSGYWPYLKANQVAAILLSTADDLGAKGVDAVYGRGMLNVNKALSAQGSLTYKTASGSATTVALGRAVASSQPKVSSPSAFGGVVTEVFDEFGRNFTSREGAALAARSQMTVDAALGRSDRLLDAAELALPDGSRFMSLQARASGVTTHGMHLHTNGHVPRGQEAADPWNRGQSQADASMMSLQLASGHAVMAGDGGLATMGMGLMGSTMAPRLSGAESVLANPLLGFAPNHRFAAVTTPLAGGWSARMGLIRSKAYDQASANINVLELMHQGRGHAFNVSVGKMAEQGMLGGYSNAPMGLAQDTSSMGMTLSAAWSIAPQWTVAGSYSSSRTDAARASGMLVGATEVRADGFGMGLVKADTWMRGDRWSFTVNAPLRAKSGSMTYSVVDSVNADDGSPVYGTRVVNLKPVAREWLAETRYSTHLSADSTLTAVAAYRQHPDHDASAPSQVVVGVRYNLSF